MQMLDSMDKNAKIFGRSCWTEDLKEVLISLSLEQLLFLDATVTGMLI